MPAPAPLRVLIAGGGTGGHVIPALAIGKQLRDAHNAEVHFVGTARGIETRLVPEAGFHLDLIHVGQLKNVSLFTRAKTMAGLTPSVLRCLQLLRTFRPHAVVGVGGYASGPAMIAAILLRIPTLAYEPNAAPGLANRIVGKRVHAAAVSFAATTKFFRNATVTGVPVRQAIFDIPALAPSAPPRLLITAGSQGARVFNEMLPRIAADLLAAVPQLTIHHQAGPRHLESTTAAYAATTADPTRIAVSAFIADMPAEYAAASLVLARSGSTVAELAAAGKPSILVPFPHAADDHQTKNAQIFADAGAAILSPEATLTAEKLFAELSVLLNNPTRLSEMSAAARTLAHPNAVETIATLVVSIARKN